MVSDIVKNGLTDIQISFAEPHEDKAAGTPVRVAHGEHEPVPSGRNYDVHTLQEGTRRRPGVTTTGLRSRPPGTPRSSTTPRTESRVLEGVAASGALCESPNHPSLFVARR